MGRPMAELSNPLIIDRAADAPGQPPGDVRAKPRLGAMAVRAGAGVGLLALVVAGGLAGAHYWSVGRFIQSSDDAYVKADSTIVAPKVAGYVARLDVDDNETVQAGQPLARIDQRDLRTALDETDAGVAAATGAIARLDAQIVLQGSLVRQGEAGVAEAQAGLALAQRDDARRRQMASVGFGSDQQADQAATDASQKTAALARQEAALAGARQQGEVLKAARAEAMAQLARAQAQQRQAGLNLGYSTLVAPVSGTVAARSVRVGQYVQPGVQLMAIVPLQKAYVVANLKETQLTHVAPGQPVRIKVDSFPGDDIEGRVASIAPATGLEFALLPPDNATGNFTKIVQRLPVKIQLPPEQLRSGRLRPGMSVSVSIDTRPAPAPQRPRGGA